MYTVLMSSARYSIPRHCKYMKFIFHARFMQLLLLFLSSFICKQYNGKDEGDVKKSCSCPFILIHLLAEKKNSQLYSEHEFFMMHRNFSCKAFQNSFRLKCLYFSLLLVHFAYPSFLFFCFSMYPQRFGK